MKKFNLVRLKNQAIILRKQNMRVKALDNLNGVAR